MESKVNEEHGFVKETEFEQLHERANEEALEMFDKRATMGKKEKIAEYRQKLQDDMKGECERYHEENKARDPLSLISNYIVFLIILKNKE